MSDREKQIPEETPAPERQPEQPQRAPRATRGQRVAAWIAVIGVIIVTLAYVYALSTGDLIRA